MNSIHQNQPEVRLEDLAGAAAIERIRAMVERSPVGFFCTRPVDPDTHGVRPMTVLQVDARGALWFLSASDSEHNRDIAADPTVRLYFQGSAHSDFLHLDGRATISTDRDRIESLWSPLFRTWFTGGIDDPRITVIRFEPVAGYYWDTRHGNVVASVKMLVGAVLGRTLDDSVEGSIAP